MSAERFLVLLTRGPEDPDRVTVAWVMANAGLALGKQTVVVLTNEGVRIGDPAVVARIAEPGFEPLERLVAQFLEGGGEVWACTPCVEKRGLSGHLRPEVKLVGAVSAVAFAAEGGLAFSF
ncbi:MAG: DsrE family protein [Firmicutes bacterium]|nr:DsrE family protein [Alicyclobacillaceae bacterium]MCL6498232.1 DsrE family protein [Bacillota bacterium]